MKGGASGKKRGRRRSLGVRRWRGAYLGFACLVDSHLTLCRGGEQSKYISEGAIVATKQRDSGGGLGRLKGHRLAKKRKEKSAPNLGLRMQGTL